MQNGKLDQTLPELATNLLRLPDERARAVGLRRWMPKFYRHLVRAGNEPGVVSRWGLSSNFDEIAQTELVAPELLNLIGGITQIPMRGPGYHAGLQHTYGYLLSLIQTPYGFKRDRWLQPTIEEGFGLPKFSLQAFPKRGTLLTNLTLFLSQLSLSDQPSLQIDGAVANFALQKLRELQGIRIREQVQIGRQPKKRIQLRTDLFPFQYASAKGECLLVYTIQLDDEHAKLVTAFPIEQAMQSALLDESRFGNRQRIQLRFNAFIDGFPREGVVGRRDQTPM